MIHAECPYYSSSEWKSRKKDVKLLNNMIKKMHSALIKAGFATNTTPKVMFRNQRNGVWLASLFHVVLPVYMNFRIAIFVANYITHCVLPFVSNIPTFVRSTTAYVWPAAYIRNI